MIPRDDERPKTIIIQSRMQYHDEGRAKEGEDILPGMLVELDANDDDRGGVPRVPPIVRKHTGAGANARKLIAKESFKQGLGIGDAIPDNDVVEMHECQPGDIVMVRVADDFVGATPMMLASAGDGTFEEASGGAVALFQVEDDVDFTSEAWGDAIEELDENDPRAQPLVRAVAL